jgi:hypothetical protein
MTASGKARFRFQLPALRRPTCRPWKQALLAHGAGTAQRHHACACLERLPGCKLKSERKRTNGELATEPHYSLGSL